MPGDASLSRLRGKSYLKSNVNPAIKINLMGSQPCFGKVSIIFIIFGGSDFFLYHSGSNL